MSGDRVPLSFTFDGYAVPFEPGDTFASALLRRDVAHIRDSLDGRPRGLYCGIGVCMECEIVVDGRAVRACMTEAFVAEVTSGGAWRELR